MSSLYISGVPVPAEEQEVVLGHVHSLDGGSVVLSRQDTQHGTLFGTEHSCLTARPATQSLLASPRGLIHHSNSCPFYSVVSGDGHINRIYKLQNCKHNSWKHSPVLHWDTNRQKWLMYSFQIQFCDEWSFLYDNSVCNLTMFHKQCAYPLCKPLQN